MSKLKELAGDKIHNRQINIDSYSAGEDMILVEGNLVDNRLKEYYLLSGEKKPPGIIHDLIIRLLIGGPDLIIKDIEVEMPGVPRVLCHETTSSLEPIKGMRIAPGFTAKVKSIVGGRKGCAHLVTLLLAMAPAAVQGFWANRSQKKVALNSLEDKESLGHYLINTCWVWREDGPMVEELLKELNSSLQ